MARATAHLSLARGFTLIELLVAISVMALLSLVSWRGLEACRAPPRRTSSAPTPC
jgi:general secretion pathway protein J